MRNHIRTNNYNKVISWLVLPVLGCMEVLLIGQCAISGYFENDNFKRIL